MRMIVKYVSSLARTCQRRLRNFAGDQRGVSAVEFAMVLPLMIALYFGTVEMSQGIGAQRKVSLTTRTIADLVSQTSNMSNTDMTNSLKAAVAVMAPFSESNLKVTAVSYTHLTLPTILRV